MSVIVFSANIGGYDNPRDLTFYDKNVRYILFTDNKHFKSEYWEVYNINFLDLDLDNRRKARMIKTNPNLVLPQHNISVWIDSCYSPKVEDFNCFFDEIKFKDKLIMCYKHDQRDCIYKEAEVVKEKKLDYKHLVDNQINKYKELRFPKGLGLFDTGFTIRKNCPEVNKFNHDWWDQIKNGSSRDQLSQVFCAWKNSVKIDPIPNGFSIYNNKYLFPKVPHPKKHIYK